MNDALKAFHVARAMRMYKDATSPPRSLLLSIRGACAMRCSFCYVKKKTGLTLKTETVRGWLKTHPSVSSVSIYGGDLCDSYAYAEELLNTILDGGITDIRVTTGGLHLDNIFLDLFDALTRQRGMKLTLQLSLEPLEWGQRITSSGTHIMTVMKDRQDILYRLGRINIHTVIPACAPVTSLSKYIDQLASLLGSYDFTCSFMPVMAQESIWSPIMQAWDAESTELLDLPAYNQKELYRIPFEAQAYDTGPSSCGATNNVTLGPDGESYSCHELAVDMDQAWRREGAAEAMHLSSVLAWSRQMLNDDCSGCNARSSCGGVCYAHKLGDENSACQFFRRGAELFPAYAKARGISVPELDVDLNLSRKFEAWSRSKTFTEAVSAVC